MEEWEGSDEGGWGGMGWGGREEEVMSVQVSRTNKRTKLQKKRDHNHNKSKVPCASISLFFFFCPSSLLKKNISQEETDTIYITSEFTAAQMSSATGVSNPTRHGSRRRPPASDCSSDPRRSRAGRSSGWGGGGGGSRQRLCSGGGGCAFGH